jgi:hypothetical protein
MSLGNIGKVLAGQAIEATKKNVIDSIVGPEPAKPADKPAAPAPQPETVGSVILGQIQAMQRPLKEDQELGVFLHTGTEVLRVTEIFVPTLQVLVFAGTDSAGQVTRVITPADRAQIVCKIIKVAPETKPVRVNVLSQRPKPETA